MGKQPGNEQPISQKLVAWLGVLLALLALWPLARALDAIALRDYLGGGLLLGLTWVLARTGVELAGLGKTL
jgi:hypothetical protein